MHTELDMIHIEHVVIDKCCENLIRMMIIVLMVKFQYEKQMSIMKHIFK